MADKITCPACGASNFADSRFCDQCSAPLQMAAAPEAAPQNPARTEGPTASTPATRPVPIEGAGAVSARPPVPPAAPSPPPPNTASTRPDAAPVGAPPPNTASAPPGQYYAPTPPQSAPVGNRIPPNSQPTTVTPVAPAAAPRSTTGRSFMPLLIGFTLLALVIFLGLGLATILNGAGSASGIPTATPGLSGALATPTELKGVAQLDPELAAATASAISAEADETRVALEAALTASVGEIVAARTAAVESVAATGTAQAEETAAEETAVAEQTDTAVALLAQADADAAAAGTATAVALEALAAETATSVDVVTTEVALAAEQTATAQAQLDADAQATIDTANAEATAAAAAAAATNAALAVPPTVTAQPRPTNTNPPAPPTNTQAPRPTNTTAPVPPTNTQAPRPTNTQPPAAPTNTQPPPPTNTVAAPFPQIEKFFVSASPGCDAAAQTAYPPQSVVYAQVRLSSAPAGAKIEVVWSGGVNSFSEVHTQVLPADRKPACIDGFALHTERANIGSGSYQATLRINGTVYNAVSFSVQAPAATAVPPTAVPVPPTATPVPLPPTATKVPPTAVPVVPTATPEPPPPPTDTPRPARDPQVIRISFLDGKKQGGRPSPDAVTAYAGDVINFVNESGERATIVTDEGAPEGFEFTLGLTEECGTCDETRITLTKPGVYTYGWKFNASRKHGTITVLP